MGEEKEGLGNNRNTVEMEEKLALYLKHFEPETPNDELLLRQLVEIELEVEQVASLFTKAINSEKTPHTRIKALQDTRERLVKLHQSIQEELGISYQKRKQTEDVTEELPRIIKGAAEFLQAHSVFIRCTSCKQEEAEVVNRLGYIVYHFRHDTDWRWECECPRCGNKIVIDRAMWLHDNPDAPIAPMGYLDD